MAAAAVVRRASGREVTDRLKQALRVLDLVADRHLAPPPRLTGVLELLASVAAGMLVWVGQRSRSTPAVRPYRRRRFAITTR
jgi:hypothetical protein